MTINEVRGRLAAWQESLGLGAWKIKVAWGSCADAHGSVAFDVFHRTASVTLNRPPFLKRHGVTVEYVLVHELLHLVLVEIELVEKAKPEQKEMALERVVNQLTNALIGDK